MSDSNHPQSERRPDWSRSKKGLLAGVIVLDLTYLGGYFFHTTLQALHVVVLAIELLFEKLLVAAFDIDHHTAVVITAYLGLTLVILSVFWLLFLAYRAVRELRRQIAERFQMIAFPRPWAKLLRQPGIWLTGGTLASLIWLLAL